MSSFIIGNDKQQWNFKNYQSIYDHCYSLIHNHRCAEAMSGLKLVYSGIKQSYQGKTMPAAQKELYKLAGFWYGYTLVELNSPYKAIAYLQPNAEVGGPKEKEEYINALSGLQDVRSLDLIEQEIIDANAHLKKHSESEEYANYRNFLLRRKAFILIDQKKYEEAETILKVQQEVVKDPDKLKLIESELRYIKQAKEE